jgi:hypothetical protein
VLDSHEPTTAVPSWSAQCSSTPGGSGAALRSAHVDVVGGGAALCVQDAEQRASQSASGVPGVHVFVQSSHACSELSAPA